MTDCIPKSHFNSIHTMPPEAKNPIIALSVVFSVVTFVAIIVVFILVRKLMALKKVGSDVGSHLKAHAPGYGTDLSIDVDGVKGKLPNVKTDLHGPNVNMNGVSGAVSVGFDKAADFGGNIKAALKGGVNVELDIGLDIDNPFYVIFNALPYASLLVNTKGVIVKANPAARFKWGYPSAELEGKLYKTLVSPRELNARSELIDDLFKVKKPFEIDSFDQKIDGVEVEVEVVGSLVTILEKSYAFLITGHVCFNAQGKRYKD